MKKVLLIALTALPLVACVGPVDEASNGDGGADVASTEEALLGADRHVDFDQVFAAPEFPVFGSTPVADGTVVDNSYAGYGVTFSCSGNACASASVFARQSSSGSNVVSVFPSGGGLPMFDVRWGVVRAEFATPRNWVSIDAKPVLPPEYWGKPVAKPYLQAYDENQNPIGAAVQYPWSHGHASWGRAETLTVVATSVKIKSVRFSSENIAGTPAVYGEFDNLRFNGDPPVVYEPRPRPIRLVPVLP